MIGTVPLGDNEWIHPGWVTGASIVAGARDPEELVGPSNPVVWRLHVAWAHPRDGGYRGYGTTVFDNYDDAVACSARVRAAVDEWINR